MSDDDSEEEVLLPIQYQNGIMSFDYIDPSNFPAPLKNILKLPSETCEILWRNKDQSYFNQRDNNGRTALHVAIMMNKFEAINILIEKIDVNIADFAGNIPLHYCKSYETAKLLCDAGSDINYLNNELETPLHKITQSKVEPQMLILFVEMGADLELRDYCEYTPLHNACYYNKLINVQILLYYGANATEINDLKLTPLIIAINEKNEEIIEELWPYLDEYELNRKTFDGKTLLMHLLKNRFKILALDLLKRNPDVNIIGHDKESAIENSIYLDDSDCLRIIWNRITDKSSFSLAVYLKFCQFPVNDFYDTLYMLLTTACLNFYRRFAAEVDINTILQVFKKFQSEKKYDCKQVISVMLSYGLEVNSTVFWKILCSDIANKYDLLHSIILFFKLIPLHNCECWERDQLHTEVNLLPFSSINIETLTNIFIRAINSASQSYQLLKLFHVLNKYLHYMHCSIDLHNVHKKITFNLKHWDRNMKIVELIEFPSLIEICRNTIRLNLIKHFHCNKDASKEIFLFIYNLEVPNRIKEILFFNAPIYKCNLECCK